MKEIVIGALDIITIVVALILYKVNSKPGNMKRLNKII